MSAPKGATEMNASPAREIHIEPEGPAAAGLPGTNLQSTRLSESVTESAV
jgi:hypothetical protein